MLLRRQLSLAAAATLAVACAPSVPQSPPPASVTYAVFDVTSTPASVPLPNDLALQPSAIAAFPPSAQQDLLNAWAAQGGFPNDQEVDITIDFQTQVIDPNSGAITNVPADLDVTTITPQTLVIFELPGPSVSYAPVQAADYVKGTDRGTLTLRNLSGGLVGAPWTAGVHYAVAVRGGPDGVKNTDGSSINPSPTFYLLTRGVNLSLPANETLLPGTLPEKAAAGAQLEELRQSYLVPFTQVSSYFPSTDLAVMSTFQIAPTTSAYVQTDPNRGLIPLPSDFLLNAAGTNVQNVPAFGALAAGIATLDGFSTTGMVLSTTSAAILGSTVNHNTVFLYDLSGATPVRVPDATEAGGVYQSEPPAIEETVNVGGTQVAVSTAIGLQPAIPVATAAGVATLPPLKENTEYAVLISNGVRDLNQAGLSRSTLAQLLLFPPDHPVAVAGVSQVSGVPDATAAVVEAMREKLAPAIAQLQTDTNIPSSDLSMAYTFRTQSITGVGNFQDQLAGVPAAQQRPAGLLQFAALPYSNTTLAGSIITTPTVNHTYSAADAFSKYGIDPSVPSGNIAEVIDATVITPELISYTTGAFDPTLASSPRITPIDALVVVPNEANVPACPTGLAPAGTHCAPLVIFHHGLGGDRTAMLAVADSLAAKGFVVAAIDGMLHGDRSWCEADDECSPGANGQPVAGSCVAIPGGAGQGDAVPPGICSNGPAKIPELCGPTSGNPYGSACLQAWLGWTQAHPTDPADGHALISGQYFVSGNFFRTRDVLRQDLIDQAALILALSPPPTLTSSLGITSAQMNIATEIGTSSATANDGAPIVVDPRYVYWEGQSLGAILGTINTAANSRITNAVLNVGGGTLTDIFTNSPAFQSGVCALLQGAGIYDSNCQIAPGETAAYLQFLILAKWILDPADPINAAGHLLGDAAHPMLPDLLTTAATQTLTYQTPKNVLGQLAECDQTVPNPFNLELYGDIGLDLANLAAPVASGSDITLFGDTGATAGSCPGAADGLPIPLANDQATLPHSFITNWGISESFDTSTGAFTFAPTDPNIASLTGAAQSEAASFLADPVNGLPPSLVLLPPLPQ